MFYVDLELGWRGFFELKLVRVLGLQETNNFLFRPYR